MNPSGPVAPPPAPPAAPPPAPPAPPSIAPSVAPRTAGPHRPLALLILAGLLALKAVLAITVVVSAGPADGGIAPDLVWLVPEVAAVLQFGYLTRVVLVLLALLLLVAAVGLVRLNRHGWVLAMVLTGMFVLIDIVAFTRGTASHALMVLNIVTVFYLNQTDVRQSLGVNAEPLVPEVELP